ncbi:NACHT domain- and WD repeat-containing protein 1-like [Amphiura filiformis]|uniref:NACHT domain- and WD repeat-containing protein 1-like n=1 Tax=Amphiura filiformis TaxID=82378 RepID=UPI003B228651
MAEDTRLAVLSGSLMSVPKPPSRNVRIFLSSTFGDTTAERNYLHKKAFPKLTDWCREKHLDFQVVDMRWGVRDEATADHMTTELCIREIRNCQQLSIGPNFMFFLGQRYGYRALQPAIKAAEFDILLKFTTSEDAGLLKDWFERDDNAVPPMYLLRPITKDVKDTWNDMCKRLTLILRQAASQAAEKGLISQRERHEYFMSVTEEEVRAALETTNTNDHTFGFIRDMHNLSISLTDPLARRYCDFDGDNMDEEAKTLLDSFKSEYVPSRLSPKNLNFCSINWTEHGVDVDNNDHVQYLEQFCDTFVDNCKTLIRRAIQKEKNSQSINDSLFLEVAHHAEFCNSKCQNFCGRKEIINEMFSSLKRKDFDKPLVLHGVSGSGKTSIMAMIAKQAHTELGKDSKVMIRFLGTTPESSSISMVIQSICRQIISVYSLNVKMPALFDQFTDLVDFFQTVLKKVSDNCKGCPLLIILDSLDQLESTHNAYQCRWLPKTCPPNVKIVMSTLPHLHGILDNLKKILFGGVCFYGVQGLPDDTMDEIMDSWMGNINRRITNKQKEYIRTAILQCPQPLFLKLAFEQAKRWHSYTEVHQEDLATTVRGAIWQLFERLERQFGKKLVSHALGYIVAARSGLTQQELEDVLSLDDDVLDEIYQYHLPPNPQAVRTPALLWARLKYELQEYMVDRQADRKTVSVLYHRQFTEAARDRYLSDPEIVKVRHQLLAEYFMGKWSQGVKKQLRLTQLNKQVLDADRSVPTQPLKYKEIYNYRKLNELPYHLLHAQNVPDLVQETFGNFEFVDALILAKSTRHLLDELQMMLSYPDIMGPELKYELEIILDTMRLAKPTLDFEDNDQPVACELLGRLTHLEEQHSMCIKPLVEGARQWYEGTSGLFLIPQRSCFPTPGEPLRTTYTGHKSNVKDMKITQSGSMLATASEDGTVRIWDVSTDEVIHVLKLPRVGQIWKVCISADDQWAVSIVFPETIQVWSLKTSEPVLSIPGPYADVVITQDSSQIVAAQGHHLEVFDITTGQKLNSVYNEAGPFKQISMCAKDKAVAAVSKISSKPESTDPSYASVVLNSSDPDEVKIWSLETKCCLHTVMEKTKVQVMIMDTAAKTLVIADESRKITIVKLPSGFENNNSPSDMPVVECETQNEGQVTALYLTKDGQTVYVGDADGLAYAWNTVTGEMTQTMVVGRCQISSLAITDDNQHMLCGTYDGSINVINLSTLSTVQSLKGQQADVNKLILVQNILVSASTQSPYIKVWDISANYLARKPQTIPSSDGLSELNVAVTQDAVFYTDTVDESGQVGVKVWHGETMKEELVAIDCNEEGNIKCLEICQQHLICGYEDGKIAKYNVDDGTEVCRYQHNQKELLFLKLRQDHKILVAKTTHSITMWDVDGGEPLKMWQNGTIESLSGLVITKDEGIICADAETGCSTLVMLSRSTDEQTTLRLFPMESVEKVGPMELSGDGTMLALGLVSNVALLNTKNFAMTWKESTVKAQPWQLSFTPDNQILIAGTSFKNIKLLSTKDGTIITSMYIYSGLLKLITLDEAVFGITYIGQFIALKLHGDTADSQGNIKKPSFSIKEYFSQRGSINKQDGGNVTLSEVSLSSESSTGSRNNQKKRSSSVCLVL